VIEITVYGTPAPQGSKRFVGVKGGHGIMIESSKSVKPWREAVKWAAIESGRRVDGPVRVTMVFTMPRPKAARKRSHHATTPDLSKLIRSTEDSLTDAGVWEDDSRVYSIEASKWYTPIGDIPVVRHQLTRPGAVIIIQQALL
jgi:crossover junction endodeoxyribonuclease RusA